MNKSQRWKGCMKCVPFEEKRLLKWKPPFIVQPKYDGIRCRAIPIQTGPTGNEYLLLSSEENVIYSVPHINETLSSLHLNAELDGELYYHGLSFEEIVSITSRTVNLHPNHKRIQFHIFDIINGEPQMRRQLLVEALRGLSPFLPIAPFWLCESLDDVLFAYDQVINLGYEGIIVRNVNAPYERKRSTMVMKFKPKKSDTYEIVGVTEEIDKDGVPKNSLGALVCRGTDGTLFQVGSGFTRDLRNDLWSRAEVLKGKHVKVQYQHLTSGKGVPRFPIFISLVEDSLDTAVET